MSEEHEEYNVKSDFTITDEQTADWYLARVAALDAEEGLLRATGEAKIKRVVNERLWLQHRFQASLEHWTRQKLEGQNVKSFYLDHGQVCLRKVSAGLKVVDKEAALKYAVDTNTEHVLRYTASLDMENYKRLAERLRNNLGEIIPGVEMIEEHDTFSVRFPKKGESNGTDSQ